MENLEIRRTSGTGAETTIFRIQGPLTLATLFDLQNAVRQPDLKHAIIDLAEVPYVDSAGLGVILSSWAHTQRLGYKFGLAGVCERVKALMEITKVGGMLPIFDSVEAAERQFADNAAAASH